MLPRPVEGAYLAAMTYASSSIPRLLERALVLRNVLMVTYHFPPSAASGSFRLLGFARHLPGHGWRSVVVAPPSLPWEPVDPELVDQIPPDTAIYTAPYPTSRVLRRLAPL